MRARVSFNDLYFASFLFMKKETNGCWRNSVCYACAFTSRSRPGKLIIMNTVVGVSMAGERKCVIGFVRDGFIETNIL